MATPNLTGKPRQIVKLTVTRVAVVDKAANGEEWLLYKRAEGEGEGDGTGDSVDGGSSSAADADRVISASDIPELAKFIPSSDDGSGPKLPYDAGMTLKLLGSIGTVGQKT